MEWDLSGISDLTTFEAALLLAGRGVPIWLLSAHKKVPAIPKWADPQKTVPNDGGSALNDATTDLETLERRFHKYGKNCNIATTTGIQAGGWQLIALDFDLPPKHEDSRPTVARLKSEGFEFPPTSTTITGTGGRHEFYWTTETRKPLSGKDLGWTGIDIQSEGQSVILPPSKFNGGDRYRIEDEAQQIEPLPLWLHEMLFPPAEIIVPRPANPLDRLTRFSGIEVSPAEHFSNTHNWSEILENAGWRLMSGDGESPGSKWQRPGGSSGCSAMVIPTGCLAIYSTGVGLDLDKAHTKFQVYCYLNNVSMSTLASEISLQNKDKQAMRPELRTITPTAAPAEKDEADLPHLSPAPVDDLAARRTVGANRAAELDTISAACSIQPAEDLGSLLSCCDPQDFHDQQLGTVWELIGMMHSGGVPVTYPNLYQRAPKDGSLDKVIALLPELFERDATRGQQDHARLVRINANQRRAIAAAHSIVNAIGAGSDWEDQIGTLKDLYSATLTNQFIELENPNDAEDEDTAPNLFTLDDGTCLLYPGEINEFHGPPKNGKSLLALLAAIENATKGKRTIYIDAESKLAKIKERLITLGATREQIDLIGRLKSKAFTKDERQKIVNTIEANPGMLIVIDAMHGSLVAYDKDENKAQDVDWHYINFLQHLSDAGATVLLIDHTGLNTETKTPRGSSTKTANVTGASYKVTGSGTSKQDPNGWIKLEMVAERDGDIGGMGQVVAEGKITGGDGLLHFAFSRPESLVNSQGIERPTYLMARIYEWAISQGTEFEFTAGDLLPKAGEIAPISGKRTYILKARQRLVHEGYLKQRTSPTGGVIYSVNLDLPGFQE